MDWQNRCVTIMGLGRHGGGVAAARYAAEAGAIVTVTDLLSQSELKDSLAQLSDLPIAKYRLGEHDPVDFQTAEIVIVNPAVPPGNPLVELAKSSGATITTELEIFLRNCPAHIAAVTGSNGKSTTTAMLAAILKQAGHQVWLGGNIGRSLLPDLPNMTSTDWVCLEVSSFQLAQLSNFEKREPDFRPIECAIVTNIQENHLDWHGTFEAYEAAKQRLLNLVQPQGTIVINPLAPELCVWLPPPGTRSPLYIEEGQFIEDEQIPPLAVLGEHNRENARCAATIAFAIGCPENAVVQALQNYRGLPHRLELIGEVDGRKFYNDSMATTPESVAEGLKAMESPVWLLAGGKDKGGDLQALCDAIFNFAAGVCFYGAARKRFSTTLWEHLDQLEQLEKIKHTKIPMASVETLDEAVAWCFARSTSGDVILLSPGCSSYDQYRDYAARAAHFRQLMQQLKSSL